MAVSISLMFARFGGVAGSNAAAYLLYNNCEILFYLAGSVVTGKCKLFISILCANISNNFIHSNGSACILHTEHSQEVQ